MGQNQDKVEGQNGSEETGRDSGGASTDTGDVIDGGTSCAEETDNPGESPLKPSDQCLEENAEITPTTPSTEKYIQLCTSFFAENEVRQGGAAGEGGEGGRTDPLVPQGNSPNQKSGGGIEQRPKTHSLHKAKKKEDTVTEKELHMSSQIKLEDQNKGAIRVKENQDGHCPSGEQFGLAVGETVAMTTVDGYAFEDTDESSVNVKLSRFGANAGSNGVAWRSEGDLMKSAQENQTEITMTEAEDDNTEHCGGTVGHLTRMNKLPPAQPQRPLQNTSDILDCGPPQEEAKIYRTVETFGCVQDLKTHCEVGLILNEISFGKKTTIDNEEELVGINRHIQTESLNTFTGTEDTPLKKQENQEALPGSTSNLPPEPSLILEKLLKRNRKEAIPVLSKIKDADTDKDNTDVPVEVSAKRIHDSVRKNRDGRATETTSDKFYSDVNLPSSVLDVKETSIPEKPTGANLASEDVLRKSPVTHAGTTGNMTADVLQPRVTGNMCRSSHQKDDCQSEETKTTPNTGCSESMDSDNFESALSQQRMCCEESGTLNDISQPSSGSKVITDVKPPSKNCEGQSADSCILLEEMTDGTTVVHQKGTNNNNGSKTAASELLDASRVKAAGVSVDGGSDPDAACTVFSEKRRLIVSDTKQDENLCPKHVAINNENILSCPCDKQPVKEKNDAVLGSEISQSSPRPRPVSGLIKESIRQHEKLQQQDWPKAPEIKPEGQAHSVTVAQMKAAFDSAQKSPDKLVKRKPSVRKGIIEDQSAVLIMLGPVQLLCRSFSLSLNQDGHTVGTGPFFSYLDNNEDVEASAGVEACDGVGEFGESSLRAVAEPSSLKSLSRWG
ncbi:uncharacterized protein si:ch211-108c6.2 [Thalassophryne amazonica]|uniref:uncharacterized protein si:ch211-108c6.2 n=1 Tax=Thalassophryne amazonica TaxID=390379 RepID=UPI0014725A25|nr:uncharacterized protein si:ch211-108c6.2 [Thalassophryne amazonica]